MLINFSNFQRNQSTKESSQLECVWKIGFLKLWDQNPWKIPVKSSFFSMFTAFKSETILNNNSFTGTFLTILARCLPEHISEQLVLVTAIFNKHLQLVLAEWMLWALC